MEVLGGCNGNLKGICSLLKGMKAQDAIGRNARHHLRQQAHFLPDQIAQRWKKPWPSKTESTKATHFKRPGNPWTDCRAFLMRRNWKKTPLCMPPLPAQAILAQGKGEDVVIPIQRGLIKPRARC